MTECHVFQTSELRLEGKITLRDLCPTLKAETKAGDTEPKVLHGEVVRRLTPTDCEALQGFARDHTRIPWSGKQESDCPEGHRYKAVGNSMATAVMGWIGSRIEVCTWS